MRMKKISDLTVLAEEQKGDVTRYILVPKSDHWCEEDSDAIRNLADNNQIIIFQSRIHRRTKLNMSSNKIFFYDFWNNNIDCKEG